MSSLPSSVNCVYDAFLNSARTFADNDFLHIPEAACHGYHRGPITLGYGEAAAQIEEQQRRYRDAGYGAGSRVALLLANRPEFFIHWLALNALGCCVVPVNTEMPAEEQAYIINHSESALLVYLPELAPDLDSLRPLLDAEPGCYSTDAAEIPAARGQPAPLTPSLESECALLYTSGSTGKPKGCILSNEYYLLSGQRYIDLGGLCAMQPGQERLITPLPLVHMNAMACSSVAMLLNGGCIVQLDRFHPRSWWRSVRDSGATVVHYLGVMPAMLLNLEPADDDFSGQVKFAFGAGVNPKHHAPFEERFGFPLIEAWGMTETGNYGAIIANHEPRHVGNCCFGSPPAHLEYQLVDEHGEQVAAGQPGELLIRHRGNTPRRGFFSGYLKNPQATAEAWEGGWFHTGDVVRENPDGTMSFVDRRKNVIRRSGENISALEVEAALAEDATLALAVVCPVPDDIRGDEVFACVVAAPGCSGGQPAAEQIVKHLLGTLAYFKVPGYVLFCDQLPLTPSGKPRRADIKTLALEALNNGQAFDTRHLKKRPVEKAS